jgi:hypothetical protein
MRDVTATGRIRVVCALLAASLAAATLAGCAASRSAGTPSTTPSTPSAQGLGAPSASAGSGAKSLPGAPAVADSAITPAPTGSGAAASTVAADQRLIVRDKTLRLEVKDVSGTIAKLQSIANALKADITDMQVSTATDQPVYPPVPMTVDTQTGTTAGSTSAASSTALDAYLTVRVPASDYQRFVDEASKLGRVLYESETSDDVTQQHIDLAARLANLQAEEARLRDFLAAARNVQDMLAVETELNRVRGDIESMSAQVAYLERQAALATVTIQLTQPQAIIRPAGTDWGWNQTFTDAIRAFVNVVEGIIVIVGALLPVVLLALAAFFVIRAFVRRRRRAAAAGTDGVPATLAPSDADPAAAPAPPSAG